MTGVLTEERRLNVEFALPAPVAGTSGFSPNRSSAVAGHGCDSLFRFRSGKQRTISICCRRNSEPQFHAHSGSILA